MKPYVSKFNESNKKSFEITLTKNWIESEPYYVVEESHLAVASKLEHKNKRITNARFREIEKTGTYYRITELGKGGKSFIFEIQYELLEGFNLSTIISKIENHYVDKYNTLYTLPINSDFGGKTPHMLFIGNKKLKNTFFVDIAFTIKDQFLIRISSRTNPTMKDFLLEYDKSEKLINIINETIIHIDRYLDHTK